MRMITDGMSKTMLAAEVLTGTGSDNDYRGVHWYDHTGTSQIHTRYGPNSSQPDLVYPLWCSKGISMPELNLPCIGGHGNGLDNFASARSHHPGGVQAVMADVSVRFVNESIDLVSWQAMGSIDNGDISQEP